MLWVAEQHSFPDILINFRSRASELVNNSFILNCQEASRALQLLLNCSSPAEICYGKARDSQTIWVRCISVFCMFCSMPIVVRVDRFVILILCCLSSFKFSSCNSSFNVVTNVCVCLLVLLLLERQCYLHSKCILCLPFHFASSVPN